MGGTEDTGAYAGSRGYTPSRDPAKASLTQPLCSCCPRRWLPGRAQFGPRMFDLAIYGDEGEAVGGRGDRSGGRGEPSICFGIWWVEGACETFKRRSQVGRRTRPGLGERSRLEVIGQRWGLKPWECPPRNFYVDVHSSSIHNLQKVETTQAPIN